MTTSDLLDGFFRVACPIHLGMMLFKVQGSMFSPEPAPPPCIPNQFRIFDFGFWIQAPGSALVLSKMPLRDAPS
jgi:hypothetical protein